MMFGNAQLHRKLCILSSQINANPGDPELEVPNDE